MKNLRFFDKFIFIINTIFAFGLLLSYLLPYIQPASYSLISVLSLGVPLLIFINFLFLIFWAIRLKRQFLLSLIVLLLGYNSLLSWIQFTDSNEVDNGSFSIMSYNVRMFNVYNWVDDDEIPQKITAFVKEKDPDVLVTQEHYAGVAGLSKVFPHSFVYLKSKDDEFGMAIFSKYPMINKQSVDFYPQEGNNNGIFVDIVKNNDTLRIFNVHFQSLNIAPGLQDIRDADSKILVSRIGYGFSVQQRQAEMLKEEVDRSPYPTIIAGDLNNTAFSYNYRYIKGERFKDAFRVAGQGFGQTFNISYFPLRIDFMFVENDIPINSFEVFKIYLSDHFPIMTRMEWGEDPKAALNN